MGISLALGDQTDQVVKLLGSEQVLSTVLGPEDLTRFGGLFGHGVTLPGNNFHFLQKIQMEKEAKIFLVFAVIAFGSFIWYDFNKSEKADESNLARRFSGIVQDIRYDIKGIPYFIINKKSYYIGAGYDVNHKIENGDSLIKKKGSTIYKLIKRKTGFVTVIDNH